MDNVIIDVPVRLDNDIEDFKIDAVEDEKNFTAARLRLCRDPDTENPVIFYSQELNRNFKNPNDPFGKRYLLKTFTPSNATASADIALEHKFTDTILAHRKKIDDYSPLTDIHSNEMNLFIDDDTATYLSDVGVNVDGLGEDFQEMESVHATPFMEEVAIDAGRLKAELGYLCKDLKQIKGKMAEEMNEEFDLISMSDDEFNTKLSMHHVSDSLVQRYLALQEKIRNIEAQLGQASETVFSETKTKIRLPSRLDFQFTL